MDISACVTSHIEREIGDWTVINNCQIYLDIQFIACAGCKLPWTPKGPSRACTTRDEFLMYLRIYGRLASLSENPVARETGCLGKCERLEFQARVQLADYRPSETDAMATWMCYPSGRYAKKTYYYTYTHGRHR